MKNSFFFSAATIVFSLITVLSSFSLCGQEFQWAKQMGGINSASSYSIAVDDSGNVVSTGWFAGTADFDPGISAFSLSSFSNFDFYISKLDSAGNFVWAKSFAGAGNEKGCAVAVDLMGDIYVTGHYSGTVDFDPGIGMFNLTSAGFDDIFILKLNAAGNFVWAAGFGATQQDKGLSITIDRTGDVLTSGYFRGTVDFDPGPSTSLLTTGAGDDIFVLKLSAFGNFVWAKNMGGNPTDYGNDIAIDQASNVVTVGFFSGTADFDPGLGVFNLISSGGTDVFISKLDASGNFVWAKQLGGSLQDDGRSIAVDALGNIYCSGLFYGTTDFDPGPGTYNLTSAGAADIFVSKIDSSGNFVWAKRMGSTSDDVSYAIATDTSENIYTTGIFQGTVDFDPGVASYDITEFGASDAFISKLDSEGNFVCAMQLGGTSWEQGLSIAVDSSNNIYTTGAFDLTTDFDPTIAVYNLTSAGVDIFVQKMSQCTPPSTPTNTTPPFNLGVCSGTSTIVSAIGAGTLGWYSAPTGGSYLGAGLSYPTLALTQNTTYYVQDSTCSVSNSRTAITVTVIPLPIVSTSGSADTVCAGNAITLSGSGATTYLWDNGVTDGVSFVPTATMSYIVIGTDTNGCSNSDSISIVVNQLPIVTVLFDTTLCSTAGVYLLTEGSPSGGTWSGTAISSGAFDPAVAGTGTFVLTYSYTDGNNCTASSLDTMQVDVCLGLTSENSLNNVVVYPNPAHESVTITFSNELNSAQTKIIVYNSLGQEVSVSLLKGTIVTLERNELPAGIYFFTISEGEKRVNGKIVFE